ncbi:MAG: ATP-binding protein [Proteobacteria bacterium]|nr:ATP-binding protein [Pseudomonadota bacterium]
MKRSDNENASDEITKPARSDVIPALVEFVSNHAWEAGFDDEKIRQINLAVEEALGNIVRFACCEGKSEITISCNVHESGAIIINIIDTGAPFNMLIASSFPEAGDFAKPGQIPSTKMMKKGIGNIEYRRAASRNMLIFTVLRKM